MVVYNDMAPGRCRVDGKYCNDVENCDYCGKYQNRNKKEAIIEQVDNKICPILSISNLLVKKMGVNDTFVLCAKNDCALWDKYGEHCCIINK